MTASSGTDDVERRVIKFTGYRALAAVAVFALAATACGSGEGGEGSDTATTGEGNAAAESPEGGGEAVSGCEEVDLSSPPSEPTTIRLGHGDATDAPVFLQFLAPDEIGAEHSGEWYEIDPTQFSPPDRLAAYQAGNLDAGTAAAPQLLSAIDQGLDIAAVASIAVLLDDEDTYKYSYLALEESGIESPEDLEGATVGIIAPNTSTEYWVISAAKSAGLDPARDLEIVSVPPPTAIEALESGQVDVQFFNDVFYSQAMAKGGFVEVFDGLTGPGFEQEFLSVWFDRSFVQDNPEVYCAWAEDYQRSMNFLLEEREAAGEILIESGMDQAPSLEAYLERTPPGRKEEGRIAVENLQLLIEDSIETGFMPDLQLNAEDVILEGYSLTE